MMKTPNARQAGFSLIELMISVVIGVLAMMFVMRTTIDFEAARRGSIGGSDSMQNGVVALFSMEILRQPGLQPDSRAQFQYRGRHPVEAGAGYRRVQRREPGPDLVHVGHI